MKNFGVLFCAFAFTSLAFGPSAQAKSDPGDGVAVAVGGCALGAALYVASKNRAASGVVCAASLAMGYGAESSAASELSEEELKATPAEQNPQNEQDE